MSSKKKHKKSRDRKKKTPRTRGGLLWAFLGIVLAGSTLLFWWSAGSDLQDIQGKWLRTDGGYIIEVRSVARDGTLDAGYYNPRPINVSEAHATQENDRTEVFIELRDVNYPGSTYTLEYDRENDVLQGIYFQAVQKQTFQVTFVRME